MPKHKPNEEIFEDGDRALRFVADFGMLEAVNSFGTDPAEIFAVLSEGLMSPQHTKNVMVSALADIDNVPVSEGKKDETVIDLINRYGLQECSMVARLLLTHALIGDIKKSESAVAQQRSLLTESLSLSRSETFWKVFLLWAAMCGTSTLAVCMIFRHFSPLIV